MSDILERTRAWFVDLPYEDVIERRRALLVQGGASIAIILTCIGVITGLLLDEGRDRVTGALLNLSLMATAIWAVVLVRRGNPTLGGAPFLAFVGLAIGWGGAFSLEDRGYSMFMGLVVMIAGISLPQRYIVLIIGAMLANIAVLFQWNPAYLRVPDGYVINLVIMMFGAWLIAGLSSMLEQHTLRQLEVVSKSEKEALVARERAVAANATKSAFLANMSHELRTPLNAIIGYAELIIEDVNDAGGDEVIIEDLERVHSAGNHLLGLINDILDLSKVEAGRATVYVEEFSLAALVEEITTLVDPLVSNGDNRLVIAPIASEVMLETDRVKLKQILFNLLSNAAKFTTKGTISVEAEIVGEEVVISVKDTGIGISKEQQARIFEAFAQADESTTREYGGTGLGLTLSLRLVELLGGGISVDSAPRKGSTFQVKLPRKFEA